MLNAVICGNYNEIDLMFREDVCLFYYTYINSSGESWPYSEREMRESTSTVIVEERTSSFSVAH